MCRALNADYGPHAKVIVPGQHGAQKAPIAALLPKKYPR
jgi:hypothetical protein